MTTLQSNITWFKSAWPEFMCLMMGCDNEYIATPMQYAHQKKGNKWFKENEGGKEDRKREGKEGRKKASIGENVNLINSLDLNTSL